ncbi:MAG: XdhC family protein, partial [Chlorobi bacterium]|nr:XdhC family protein [Chlorobiota bacterium]
MKEIWKFILNKLEVGKRVILMVIIENRGSSPGKAGFKMAVAEDGAMKGSIGGGAMEYRLAEMAKKELESGNPKIFLKREIHDPEAEENSSGMICAGENLVASYPLSTEDIPNIQEIVEAVEKMKEGMVAYNQTGIKYEPADNNTFKIENSPEKWHFAEHADQANHLYIFGAGHVGLALS